MKMDGKLEGRELSPRAAQVTIEYDVIVRCEADEVDARILNMSRNGFRLRTVAELRTGSEITLEMPEIDPVKAIVRWASGFEAGGVFLDAVAL